MSEIAFTYNKDANPGETFIPGVPLRDLTVAEFLAMPKYLRAGVQQLPFYAATEFLPPDIFEVAPDADPVVEAAAEQPTKPTPSNAPSEATGATPAAVTSARRTRPTPSETKDDANTE